MINLIRHLFVRPVIRVVAVLAQKEFDEWKHSYSEMRYHFKDSDGIQLSKEFPDVRAIGIQYESSFDFDYSFKPTTIKMYVGNHVRDSGEALTLTKNEQKYLRSLLLSQYTTKSKRAARRTKKQQDVLAYEMAKSLKKHIK